MYQIIKQQQLNDTKMNTELKHGQIIFEGSKFGATWEVSIYNEQVLVKSWKDGAKKEAFYPVAQLDTIKQQFGC